MNFWLHLRILLQGIFYYRSPRFALFVYSFIYTLYGTMTSDRCGRAEARPAAKPPRAEELRSTRYLWVIRVVVYAFSRRLIFSRQLPVLSLDISKER